MRVPHLKWPRLKQLPMRRKRELGTSTPPIRDSFNALTTIRGTAEPTTDGPLSGTLFAIKDNICTIDDATTCALETLRNYQSPFDATVVKLLQGAGLVAIGKLNLDEFGMGAANIYSCFGAVKNPRHEGHYIAGGSSGGSAAAVAAELCNFALGTDTGGSVRVPASFCDIVGFKPTYGRISRWGVIPYAQSLDTVGILAPDVATTSKVFSVLDRFDTKDPTSMPQEIRSKLSSAGKNTKVQWVVGIPQEMILDDLSDDALEVWQNCLIRLFEAGHILKRVSVPAIKDLLPAYYTIATAEAASNLSRFDGVRFGLNISDKNQPFAQQLATSRLKGFGEEVQRRIILGNYTLSSSSGDHCARANEIRRTISSEFNSVFNRPHPLLSDQSDAGLSERCDVLISPASVSKSTSVEAYKANIKLDLLSGYINDILVIPASLAGLPAISLPSPERLNIQAMAQYGDDHNLLSFSQEMENLHLI